LRGDKGEGGEAEEKKIKWREFAVV